mmetsp:Transcript_30965/g.66529  ORF Transcript_30965/g.66529 Transcript_30965/m.66529 type:complete len:293 (-) Transcript_30965:83-961(-)
MPSRQRAHARDRELVFFVPRRRHHPASCGHLHPVALCHGKGPKRGPKEHPARANAANAAAAAAAAAAPASAFFSRWRRGGGVSRDAGRAASGALALGQRPSHWILAVAPHCLCPVSGSVLRELHDYQGEECRHGRQRAALAPHRRSAHAVYPDVPHGRSGGHLWQEVPPPVWVFVPDCRKCHLHDIHIHHWDSLWLLSRWTAHVDDPVQLEGSRVDHDSNAHARQRLLHCGAGHGLLPLSWEHHGGPADGCDHGARPRPHRSLHVGPGGHVPCHLCPHLPHLLRRDSPKEQR